MRAGAPHAGGLALLLLALTGWGGLPAAQAQEAPPAGIAPPSTGQLVSPLLTIDPDRLLAESLYGQRLQDDLRAASEALAAENRSIEAELTAEEHSLTEQRPDMEPDAFRAAAEAFDTKVQQIRNEQDAKERALQQQLADGRDSFFQAATPVLGRLMIERRATAILDRRNVFIAIDALDITDEAIAAIDAELGDGTG